MLDRVQAKMLAGVDFYLQTEPDDGRQLGFKPVSESGSARADVGLGFAEPRVQAFPEKVEGGTSESDVLRAIEAMRQDVQAMERRLSERLDRLEGGA